MGALEKGLPNRACTVSHHTKFNVYIAYIIQEHGKRYSSDVEERNRYEIWEANRKLVELHNRNADRYGFTMEMNMFGDLVSKMSKPDV